MSLPPVDTTKQADGLTTTDLAAVMPDTAEVRDGRLYIGGVDTAKLAQDEGTALIVFDETTLRHRMEAYREAFEKYYGNASVLYASKSFINGAVLELAAEEGLCLDVSGGGELAWALAVGFPAERIFVHGNNKTPQELAEALDARVGTIVVDNLTELARVGALAEERGITQGIYLRITPGIEADTHAYVQTGCEDSKFGFTLRDGWALSCVGEALKTPGVELKGLHCHIGSQIFGLDSFVEAARVMVDFIALIRDTYGAEIRELDLGGGLGVAYEAGDKPPAIEVFAQTLSDAVRGHCEAQNLPLPRLLVEPGRSLVANAAVTLYTVGSVKTLPGIRTMVAIDGGMSDNIRPALYGSPYEATLANKADEPRTTVVTVVGKHCESGDFIIADGSLQPAEVGDILCVFGTGAYCATMASNYNGQPRPAIVFVKDGQARVVTRRETYADLRARDVR